MKYIWKDFNSIADQLSAKAKELRAKVADRSPGSHIVIEARSRAVELESVANMLRQSEFAKEGQHHADKSDEVLGG